MIDNKILFERLKKSKISTPNMEPCIFAELENLKSIENGIEIINYGNINYGIYVENSHVQSAINLSNHLNFHYSQYYFHPPINKLLDIFFPELNLEYNFMFGFHKKGTSLEKMMEKYVIDKSKNEDKL